MTTARYSTLTLYRRLLRQAQPYWAHLGSILLLSLLSTPLALLTPLPLKIAVDSMLGSQPLPRFLQVVTPAVVTRSDSAVLALAVGLIIATALLNQLQGLATSLLRTYVGGKLVLDFRGQLFRHVQRLSFSYHDTKGTTDSAYRIQYDAPAIQWLLIHGIIPFTTAGCTLIGMIYVTSQIDWQLALVALMVSPVLFIASWASGPRLRSQWRQVKKLESSAFSVIEEVLAAVRVVKAFGQEDREQERFLRRASEGFWALVRVTFAEGKFGLLIGLTTAIGTAAVLFIGMHHVKTSTLTLGGLLLVMSYLVQLYAPLQTLSKGA
jgi:ATP-binding cassette, subfamily B, bacterial